MSSSDNHSHDNDVIVQTYNENPSTGFKLEIAGNNTVNNITIQDVDTSLVLYPLKSDIDVSFSNLRTDLSNIWTALLSLGISGDLIKDITV